MMNNLAMAAAFAATSTGSGLVALWVMSALGRRRSDSLSAGGAGLDETIFLFEDHELVDATEPARALLRDMPSGPTEWDRLMSGLASYFPALDDRLSALPEDGELHLNGTGSRSLVIQAHHARGFTRITVIDPGSGAAARAEDGLTTFAAEAEMALLRSAVTNAPILMWRTEASGTVDWANHAYIRRSVEHLERAEDEMTWPLPVLFETKGLARQGEPRRLRVVSPDPSRPQWFECRSHETDDGTLNFALPIDATVRAEAALREFVQTLTKTFAHLPIGLAIFDRQRQLALFNPALIDLTSLNPDLLSRRPTLFAFLDSLREARMIPEPKDYPSWRQTMTDLESAAASGLYEETWALPTGQTYRVTGRPHPDGAVAFQFEDITAETSLTRRFRSEIEMGQAVIDKLEDAIAVFSHAGRIVLSNLSYAAMWGIDPNRTVSSIGLEDAFRGWVSHSASSARWDLARDFVTDIDPREDLVMQAEMVDGERVLCRLSRLNGGGTMVRFRRLQRVPAPPRIGQQAERAEVPSQA